MRKYEAIQDYLETFMRKAFPDAPVNADDYYLVYTDTSLALNDDPILPYMTYEKVDGDFGDADVQWLVRIWFHTESERIPDDIGRKFRAYIEKYNPIKCDEGYICLKPGQPFSLTERGENMTGLKCKRFNLVIEFNTRGDYDEI